MEKLFKEWMLAQGLQINTVNAYSNAINRLSEHYSENSGEQIDIYSIKNINTLDPIKSEYNRGGKYEDFGDRNNGLCRAAVNKYALFIISRTDINESDTIDESMSEAITNFAYEKDLQKTLCSQISSLFPGYKIYGEHQEGIEYQIENRRIDVLLEHIETGALKILELKSGTADYKVFGQICMYMGLINKHFPSIDVTGVIIAGSIDSSLSFAASTNDKISLKIYNMSITLEDI